MKNKFWSLIPFAVMPFATTSTLSSTVSNGLNTLTQDIISVFDSLFSGLVKIFLNVIQSALSGILGFIGVPFSTWSVDVSQQGLIIPIIFVGILGIAGAIGYFFFDIYGFEGDIRGGESDVGNLEEKIGGNV